MSVFSFIPLLSAAPLALFIAVAVYVMYSYGLYKMADNTGVKHAGLAWIPLLRLYTLGQLADRYNNSNEKKSAYRFLLPLLRVIGIGFGLMVVIFSCLTWMTGWRMALSVLVIPGAVLSGLIELACRVLELLSYYKTFCDYEPEYSVLYLILCVLGLEWLPMFLCRHNVPVGIAGHCHPKQPRYDVV